MKKVLFVIVMLVVSTSFAMAQKNAKQLEVQLIQMDKDWTAAELKGDVKTAGTYVADDFWQTNPAGLFEDRAKYISQLTPSKDADVADQYVVRFFGPDLAVMTHRGTVRGERDYQYRSTHVWANRGGKWQIVAHHSSEIAPAANLAVPSSDAAKMKEKQNAAEAASDAALPAAAAGEKPK
jgi:hypothetical protein